MDSSLLLIRGMYDLQTQMAFDSIIEMLRYQQKQFELGKGIESALSHLDALIKDQILPEKYKASITHLIDNPDEQYVFV